jgi:hypothetical protein
MFFLPVNLIKVMFLTNTYSQIEHKKMTSLIKMTNVF